MSKLKNKEIIFVCIMFVILIGWLIISIRPFHTKSKEEPEISLDDCKNLSLTNTTACLVSYVKTFYYYNYSNVNVSIENMTFDRVKKEGGVCRHYAHYYEKWGEELGYNSKHITLLPEIKHGFSVLYDDTGWCVIDQTNYWCGK